jgi:hypothetical protein
MVKLTGLAAALGAIVNPDGTAVLDDAAASASASTADAVAAPSLAASCPIRTADLDTQWLKFHSNRACNRDGFNLMKDRMDKHGRHLYLKQSGDHARIPDAKTVACPAVVSDLKVPNQVTGFDTSWLVENTASTPVMISYIRDDGVEVSAVNGNLIAGDDPQAVLQPGQWKAFHTHQGHIFHVREILKDGSAGKILLQHRVGLIPIGGTNLRNLACPDADDEPVVLGPDGTKHTDPNFQRTKGPPVRDCNTLEIGFRNAAGCPLHGYYLRPDSCEEVFKLHLGVNPGAPDFMKDWSSLTKYESTFVGHTFVFRSAFSDQVVDQITVQPTQIPDCPDLKQQVVTTSLASANVVMVPSANRMLNNGGINASNNTTTIITTTAAAASALLLNGNHPSITGGSASSFMSAAAGGGGSM